MPVKHHQRIFGLGMFFKPFWQQYVGPQIHVPPIEFGELFRFDLNMLDPFGILGLGDRRDDLIQGYGNIVDAIFTYCYFERCTVQIAGRGVPMLPLAIVHRKFHGMARGQIEGFIHM